MVLDQAARLTDDPQIRFAALVHDLGKGNTPRGQWPSHHEHEKRGVELIKSLCKRYRIPNAFCDLAVLVALYHADCHRVRELRPETLLKKT
jgi:HD domain.